MKKEVKGATLYQGLHLVGSVTKSFRICCLTHYGLGDLVENLARYWPIASIDGEHSQVFVVLRNEPIKDLVEPRSWFFGNQYCHNWRSEVCCNAHDGLRVLRYAFITGSLGEKVTERLLLQRQSVSRRCWQNQAHRRRESWCRRPTPANSRRWCW